MDVFVIPIGTERYELYCETPVEAPQPETAPSGIIGRLRYRFAVMLHQAEDRRRGGQSYPRAATQLGRLQEWIMAWVAERIAEQRLLWSLRRQREVIAFHPQDLTFEQTLTLIHRVLQRDYERHRVWLVVDTLLLIGSIGLILLPGPNIIGYYFAFRVIGHWLSIRGAQQGLRDVTWTGRPCEPLTKLRDVTLLNGDARSRRVQEIQQQLRLQHLSSFFERIAVRSA
jgi:K+-H+ exchange-related protein